MPSETICISMNENDNIEIITEKLRNNNQILNSLVSVQNKNSNKISPNEKNNYLITFNEFYKINSLLLESFGGGSKIDKKFKQFPYNNETLNMYATFLEQIWLRILRKYSNFITVLNGRNPFIYLRIKTDSTGQPLLDERGNVIPGGEVFAYPIGYFIIAEVLKLAAEKGKSIEDTIDALMTNIPTNIDQKPWINIIWNPITHKIIDGKRERKLMVLLLGVSLNLQDASKTSELTQLYQDIVVNLDSPLPIIKWTGEIQDEIDDSGFLCL